MFKNASDFVAKGIPSVVDTDSPLTAVFVTYNTVSGYGSGDVQVEKTGLKVVVEAGNTPHEDLASLITMQLALEAGDHQTSGKISRQWRDDAAAGQSRAEENLSLDNNDSKPLLAVVYAGFSAFSESFEFARRFRNENANAKVVVLTCDCGIERKQPALETAVASGDIDTFVVDYRCGGRQPMREILEGLVNSWPSETAAA